MATKTQSKTNDSNDKGGSSDRLWGWDRNETGVVIGAAVAGVAAGLAANLGRKFLMQATSGAAGDWVEALTTEHELTKAIFDKIEETDETQTGLRSALLSKLKYALAKHAVEEENVVYPALRHANQVEAADELNSEHGYVKTYLYELETMANDDPQWIARVRDFRRMIEEHMREEENDVFPALRAQLTDEQNKKLTAMMNKEGFKVA